MEKAVNTIKDDLAHQRRVAAEARKSPNRKAQDRLKKSADFFYKHAGYSYGPGQTKRQGRMEGAMKLAQAEQEAEARNWTIEWSYDDQPYEVLVAVLKDEHGNSIGSLGGIGDPDSNYRRVVEAELALEALSTDPRDIVRIGKSRRWVPSPKS